MDFEKFYIILVVGVVLFGLQIAFRRLRPAASSQAQMINSLLSDIRINQRLLEVMLNGEEIKRFANTGWNLYKDKLEFLDRPLRETVLSVGEIAEDYNQQKTTARKNNNPTFIPEIDMGKMNTRLRKSRSGLEDWLMIKTGTIDPGGKPGFFDNLLGR